MLKSLVKFLASREPCSRVPVLVDSQIALGACAHGRSSSPGLSRAFRSALSYIIGADLYIGGLYVPTAVHRADDPTRNIPIRPPSQPNAFWLLALRKGDLLPFDLVDFADELLVRCSSGSG